jgi:type I restriction enzyme S subunit
MDERPCDVNHRVKAVCREIDVRAGLDQPPLLSVSIHHGVVPRTDLTGDQSRAEDLSRYKLCEEGDIVLNRMRAFQGAIGISRRRGLVSPDYLVLRPRLGVEARFLHYTFRSDWFVGEMISRLRGIGSTDQGNVRTPRINADDLLDIGLAIPDLEEQRRIAAFLDDQVARIDNVIAARRQQADLVDAALDAEIENTWLPSRQSPMRHLLDVPREEDVPSTWTIRPLGAFLSRITYGFTNPMPISDDGPYMLTAADIGDGQILFGGARRTSDDAYRTLVTAKSRPEINDVLLTKDGTLGRVAEADGTPCCINQSVALLRPRAEFADGVIAELLRVPAYRDALVFNAGGTAIKHLYISRVATQKVAMPPSGCRALVVAQAKQVRTHYESVRHDLAHSIALLDEFKRSLITAAVTGEFEVSTADGSRVPA